MTRFLLVHGIRSAMVATVALGTGAQTPNSPVTVAQAIGQAARLGTATISVHGHFWCGKEGSMIYDSYYKSIMPIRFSETYLRKHTSFRSACGFDIEHKSNLVVMTGHIEGFREGTLALVVNELAFDK